jgi:methionyl-tRNA formyltransferase
VLEGQNVKLFGARRTSAPATSPLEPATSPLELGTTHPEPSTTPPEPGMSLPEPGTVLAVDPAHGVLVATLDGAVLITEVQPPGRRRMHARDWINGRGVEPGQRFE